MDNIDLLANWNGKEMPLNNVRVSVLDRAFLFGDSVYEVIRVYNKFCFRVDDHFDRMKKSLDSLQISGVDIPEVRRRLHQLINNSGLDNALAYLQITRGVAKRTHHYPQDYTPNILIYVEPFGDPYKQEREHGAKAVTHPDIRWRRNDIKATSLAANCMASSFARQKGCFEVIFINNEGFMTEGSHTSIFGIKEGKLLVTPSGSNVLPGITKRQVLEIAENIKLPVEEARVKEEEIHLLDELFLAGTPEEIIPIVSVDDKQVGDGKPGPIVSKIYDEFQNILCATSA